MSKEAKTVRGKVKFYSEQRRFGFIQQDDKGEDLFFHYSEVEGNENLQQDDRVEFEVAEGDRGLKAIKVRRVTEKEEKEEVVVVVEEEEEEKKKKKKKKKEKKEKKEEK